MLEAKLERAEMLKKILDAVKELVTDANWDCSEEGMKLQAMDNSHIALVSLDLKPESFMEDAYRCDRNMSLGMNLTSLQKIIKCAGNDDEVTLRAGDDDDNLSLTFQNRKADRMGEYEMKLMDIDQEHLGIPDTQYDAIVNMPSSEFLRIVRDIKELGESVKIEVTKEGVKFSSEGDIGTAAVTLRPTTSTTHGQDSDSDSGSEEEEEEEEEEEQEEEAVKSEEEDENAAATTKKSKSKKKVVADSEDEDEDTEMGADKSAEDKKPVLDLTQEDEDEEAANNDDDDDAEQSTSSKRKRAASDASDKKPDVSSKKADKKPKKQKKAAAKSSKTKAKGKVIKKSKKSNDDEPNRDISINLTQSVSLTFSIKYLLNFAKSTPLSDTVSLHLSADVPLLVQYDFIGGSIKFYLAPKISDE